MRLSSLSLLAALVVLAGVSSERAPGAGKSGSSSSSKSSSSLRPHSSYNPGIFFPHSSIRPWGSTGGSTTRTSVRLKNGARIVPLYVDFTVTFNSDVGKVRTIDPPEEYDEKGNLRKLTREELKKAKGDDPVEKKMVGYKSDFSELQVGDIVQVALSTKKKETAKKTNPEKDDKAESEVDKTEAKPAKWVVAGQLLGKVTKIDSANTDAAPKVTVKVTSTQVVQIGQRAIGNRKQTIGDEQAQATLVVIGHRPVGPPRP
jgi:hypothetical protein